MTRRYREQGIVLRTWKLGETDRILSLLTLGRGQVRAVAKGIRRPGSRFGGRLEPYSLVDLQLHQGRNLDIVTDVELIAAHATVREHYGLSACAATMAELVDAVAREQEPDNPLFLLLKAGLQALEAAPPDPTIFVDAFLLRLAGVAGFPVSVDGCARCGRAGDHRFLSVKGGGMLCPDCAPAGTRAVDGDTLAQVRLLAGGRWQPLPEAADDTRARRTASSFARAYTEHHLDRRLRSYDLLPDTPGSAPSPQPDRPS